MEDRLDYEAERLHAKRRANQTFGIDSLGIGYQS
jgi:hypothetical protein